MGCIAHPDRRFSDFLGLHGKLTEKYLPNGRLLPPVPEKDVYNLAMLKIGGATGTGEQGEGEKCTVGGRVHVRCRVAQHLDREYLKPALVPEQSLLKKWNVS